MFKISSICQNVCFTTLMHGFMDMNMCRTHNSDDFYVRCSEHLVYHSLQIFSLVEIQEDEVKESRYHIISAGLEISPIDVVAHIAIKMSRFPSC